MIGIREKVKLLEYSQQLAGIAVWQWNIKTDELYWSDRLFEIFEVPVTENNFITIENAFKSVHPDDIELMKSELNNFRDRGEADYFYRIITPAGKIKSLHLKGKIEAQESAEMMIGTVQDITDMKLMEEKILSLNKTLKEAQTLGKIGTWEYDINTGTLTGNEELYKIYELQPGTNIDFLKSLHPDDYEKVRLAEKNLLENKKFEEFSVRIIVNSGDVKILYIRGNLIKDESGEVTKLQGITQDITFLKNTEHELLLKNLELERINSDLSTFAYVASHDLNEPLRKILTFAERILKIDEARLSEQGKDYFKRLNNAASRMSILLNDLLKFSRAGTAEKNYEKTDLNAILENVKSDLSNLIDETGAQIISERLPVLNVIPSLINQLFQNVLSNCLKFIKPGIPPVIKITSQKVKGYDLPVEEIYPRLSYWKISVTDNGIGFDPSANKKIFNVFQRLHSRHQYPGTGIGLAICMKIVNAHNGFIYAEGQPGEGATFIIVLPENYTLV